MIKHAVAILLSLLSASAGAQSIPDIDRVAAIHQECLDEGKDMKGCARSYYLQMDSMLNVVYKKLRASLNTSQQAALKQEQLQWLKARDRYLKKQRQEYDTQVKKGEWGSDMFMVVYDNAAMFVEKRVRTLIMRMKKP